MRIDDAEARVLTTWSEFLVAIAGASSALTGLVFVALSINLARIIELPGVSGRAAETLIVLAGALIGSLAALMPNLTQQELGAALLAVALPTWALPLLIQIRAVFARTYHRVSLIALRAGLHQVATLPGVAAGLSLCGAFGGGMAWFALGAILSLLVAMFGAWVLLVEILR